MATIPTTLEGWTYEAVVELLREHVHEDASFDWKVSLRGNPDGIRQCAAAMANAGGGFIVFGVHDDRAREMAERLVGVDRKDDLPKMFSDLLKGIDPGVPFVSNVVPFPDHADLALFVVELRPTLRPHSMAGTFLVRAPANNVPMRTREVADLVVRREELLAKARLLLLEIAEVHAAAHCVVATVQFSKIQNVREMDLRMLGELHAAVLPLIGADSVASTDLAALRSLVAIVNYQVAGANVLLVDGGRKTVEHLRSASGPAQLLVSRCEALVPSLASSLGIDPPKLRTQHDAYNVQ